MKPAVLLLMIVAAAGAVAWWAMIRMPGESFRGTPPPLSLRESAVRDELMRDVGVLAGEIGERNVQQYRELSAGAEYIEGELTRAGYTVRRAGYSVAGRMCDNIEAEIRGRGAEVIVVGAHYDSVIGSPGANDNASGVAALLALARRFVGRQPRATLRFVAFPNEEPIYFRTPAMGSWVYAAECRARGDQITGMISIETIGCFSGLPGSQHYPLPGLGMIYPDAGNFIGFVGNVRSRALVRRAIRSFRDGATIASEGAALPSGIPGIGWSDHWAFWKHGYPAIMITDTAPFRYPHYHRRTDTPDKLDYESMARVVEGLERVIADLSGVAPSG